MLAGVVLLPALTRMLSDTDYGLVAVALIVIQFGTILMGLGLSLSIVRHAILEESGLPGARGLVVSSLLTAGVICALGLVSGRWWSGMLLGQPWVLALGLAVLAAAAAAVVANVQALLRAEDRAWLFVALASAGTLIGPLVGILLMLTTERTPRAYVVGLAVAYLCAAGYGVVFVMRSGDVLFRRRELGLALKVGLPTIPHQLALALATGAMVLIATRHYGQESLESGLRATAWLTVALFIGIVPTYVTSALNNAWAPLVMRAPASERAETINKTAVDIGWIAACGSSVIALLAPWFIQIVAPTYPVNTMVPVVATVATVAVLSVTYLASSHLIFVSGRTTGLAISTPISLGVGIVTASVLVGPLGLFGASSGIVAMYLCLALSTWILSRMVSADRWSPSVMVPPTALALCGALLGGLLPFDGLGAALRVGLSLAVALFGVRVLRRAMRPA
jgi:O-antigen/teichoic acid export membrane protein